MAAKPVDKSIIEKIIVDWRVGRLSQQDIAEKYKVSKGFVNKHCKGIEQDIRPIVTAGIEFHQALQAHDDRIVTAVHDAVHDEIELRKFFRDAHVFVAKTALQKLQEEKEKATFQDIHSAASTLLKAKEGALGKTPDTVVQNNLNQTTGINVATIPAQDLRKINQELEGAC